MRMFPELCIEVDSEASKASHITNVRRTLQEHSIHQNIHFKQTFLANHKRTKQTFKECSSIQKIQQQKNSIRGRFYAPKIVSFYSAVNFFLSQQLCLLSTFLLEQKENIKASCWVSLVV